MKFFKYLSIPLILISSIFNTVQALSLQELRNDSNLELTLTSDRGDFYIDKHSTRQLQSTNDEIQISSIIYIVDYKKGFIFEDHITYNYNPQLGITKQIEYETSDGTPVTPQLIDRIMEDKKIVSGITSALIREVIYSFDGKVLYSNVKPKTLTFDTWESPIYQLGNEAYAIIFNKTYDDI